MPEYTQKQGPRVLLVDDDRQQNLLLTNLLGNARAIHSVTSGQEALQLLEDTRFDVLISDLNMEGMPGLELLRLCRHLYPDMICVVLSGTADRESVIKALREGAFDFLLKPISPEVLSDSIAKAWELLRTGRQNRELLIELDRTNRELREQRAQTEALVQDAPDAILSIDRGGNISSVNTAACQLFGIDHPQAQSMNFCELVRSPSMNELLAHVTAGTQGPLEGRGSQAGGSELRLELSAREIDHQGKQSITVIVRDVTHQRELEGQLVQAQKLESIGQLAAGIAHEINTPIQYVGDNLNFLEETLKGLMGLLNQSFDLLNRIPAEHLPAEPVLELKRAAEEIDLEYLKQEIPTALCQSKEGVRRVSEIVRGMKEFSHPGGDEITPTDLNRAIQSTATVARNEWKYVSELSTDLDPDLPLVACLPGELNQVILNLIINASHAIQDKLGESPDPLGSIRISTRKIGDQAEIRVSDTGCGIPESAQSRIFDPFFTTKEVGKGTGQGLSIARNVIVKKHQGTLTFETTPGEGTTFIIRLPIEQHARQPEEVLQ